MVLIDAAKGCTTEPPDLARFPADFVVFSFYKVYVTRVVASPLTPNCNITNALDSNYAFLFRYLVIQLGLELLLFELVCNFLFTSSKAIGLFSQQLVILPLLPYMLVHCSGLLTSLLIYFHICELLLHNMHISAFSSLGL